MRDPGAKLLTTSMPSFYQIQDLLLTPFIYKLILKTDRSITNFQVYLYPLLRFNEISESLFTYEPFTSVLYTQVIRKKDNYNTDVGP